MIQHWNTLVCLYIGSIFYALLISSVSFVMANMNIGKRNLSEEVLKINDYAKSKQIPKKLKSKMRDFFRIQYADGQLYVDDDVLSNLPPNLSDEIHYFLKKQYIEIIPAFNKPDSAESLVFRLSAALATRAFFDRQIIVHEDSAATEMYFIASGLVEVLTKHRQFMVKVLADGCYFGDVSLLLGCKRTASIRAKTMGTLSVLEKDALLALTGDYPELDT